LASSLFLLFVLSRIIARIRRPSEPAPEDVLRRLMLLRHAKSDWSRNGARDRDRTLATRGQEAAPMVGAYMAQHGLTPDAAKVSPAQRTRQTWELAAPAFHDAVETAYDERIYGASTATLLTVVRETHANVHSLLLVGHNPGFQELAQLLIGEGDSDARLALLEKFPTAALAVIDFRVDRWSSIEPHSGRLDRFVTPRSLRDRVD
jgi:phosphohistidine phosphatase